MSNRAQKILTWLKEQNASEIPIRQQSLADLFECSRRTIGRALKELKEAGLLIDLNQRHQNRCKIYEVVKANPHPSAIAFGCGGLPLPHLRQGYGGHVGGHAKGEGITPQGEQQLKLYRPTFEVNFRDWPNWEKYYPQVTQELPPELNADQLFRQTFDKLYEIRDNILGNQDSNLD